MINNKKSNISSTNNNLIQKKNNIINNMIIEDKKNLMMMKMKDIIMDKIVIIMGEIINITITITITIENFQINKNFLKIIIINMKKRNIFINMKKLSKNSSRTNQNQIVLLSVIKKK